MSEKPIYHAVKTVGWPDEYHERIARGWDTLTGEEVCRILNTQAEQIEVLRQMIKDEETIESERTIVRMFQELDWQVPLIGRARYDLAKRRIAALEGK